MKSKPFTLDSLGKTRRDSASTHAKKAMPKKAAAGAKKRPKLLSELIEDLRKFEWDFDAMARD